MQCIRELCARQQVAGRLFCLEHIQEKEQAMDPELKAQHDADLAMLVGKVEDITQIKEVNLSKPQESSGGDNDYWVVEITDPKRLEPYKAECDDIIEAFQMSYQEGEAFKALWRNGAMRLGKGKPGDSHLRNAQKTAYYSGRMLKQEERKLKK